MAKLKVSKCCLHCNKLYFPWKETSKYCSYSCRNKSFPTYCDPEKVFWTYVDKPSSCACWEWKGRTDKDGYGRFCVNGITYKSHRFSYELHYEALGKFWCLHKCDNTSCVNPKHLFKGTIYDNIVDRQNKSRQAKGEIAGNGKRTITKETAIEIRNRLLEKESVTSISKKLNVGRSLIGHIKNGNSWKYLSNEPD